MRRALLLPVVLAALPLGMPAARGEPDPVPRALDGCAVSAGADVCARFLDLGRRGVPDPRFDRGAAAGRSAAAGSVLALPARPGGTLGSAFPEAGTAAAGPTEATGPVLRTAARPEPPRPGPRAAPVEPPRGLAAAILLLAFAAAAGVALSRRGRRA